VMRASPVAGVYDEAVDRESASEILQKRTAEEAETKTAEAEQKQATKTGGGSSRSDSFWTTLGKTIIRTAVPAATRILEQSLKRNTRRGGGFTGFGMTSEVDKDDKPKT
ncbi:helicase HerA-like domain-containing protein, partial [Methyloceanibacter sp.]|uniref:helicase HerA-like domain-containing protein n=1 Tax=Methyloceanibacter sp. TaxID=1965321 RepID=UPI002D41F0E2